MARRGQVSARLRAACSFLFLTFLALSVGCSGSGGGDSTGGVIADPSTAPQQVQLVVTPDPEQTTCTHTGGPSNCGCVVHWTWQTDTAADTAQANQETEIALGLLAPGTPVSVEGEVTCCNFPFPGGSHGGTIEVFASGNLVAVDSCQTPAVPQLGCVQCVTEASYTVPE